MLKIVIPKMELFDEKAEEFITIKETELQLEHSLISLAKWERKWHKPFLYKKEEKTIEEIQDYIRCMTLTKGVDPMIYKYIPASVLKQIFDYIDDPMTATWFSNTEEKKSGMKKEIITNEIIYYWMISLGIPVQFEKWHLNSLITLIRVVNVKNAPSKKMSKKEILAQNARINAARRAKHKTKG